MLVHHAFEPTSGAQSTDAPIAANTKTLRIGIVTFCPGCVSIAHRAVTASAGRVFRLGGGFSSEVRTRDSIQGRLYQGTGEWVFMAVNSQRGR